MGASNFHTGEKQKQMWSGVRCIREMLRVVYAGQATALNGEVKDRIKGKATDP